MIPLAAVGSKCWQMRSWSHSLHSLAALSARARIPQHQSCRVVSSQAASTTSAPKDASHMATSEVGVKNPELRELARPLGLPDPPRTTPLTEKEKLAKYLDPQKRLEERNHLCVVNHRTSLLHLLITPNCLLSNISLTPSSTLTSASLFNVTLVGLCLG